MRFLDRVTLRTKLLLIALIGATGTLVAGGAALWILRQSTASTGTLAVANSMQRAQMDADMMHDAVRSDVYAGLLAHAAGTAGGVTDADAALAEHGARLRRQLGTVDSLSADSLLQASLRSVTPAIDAYLATGSALIRADESARTEKRAQFDRDFVTLEGALEALGDRIETISTEAFERLAATKVLVMGITATMIALTILLALVLERHISASIRTLADRTAHLHAHAITQLRTAIESMARGDLSAHTLTPTPPLQAGARDRLGILTQTLNQMIDATAETFTAFDRARGAVQRLVTETETLSASAMDGDLARRADERMFDGSYRDVVGGINRTLDAVIEPVIGATQALERLAARDLSVRVTGQFRGDHAKIQQAFNAALDNVATAMSAVSDTAAGVARGAVEIEAGSRQLAQAANEQASALEEVAASARQMSAVTHRNAEGAAEARALAAAAQQSTTTGSDEVRQLARAMDQIRESAQATARIVKTIDEIAFQTNLLALNAAVEAARAGESGRGFAVVADEVRALSMRSAEAARNTAALIEQSVRSSELGVTINERVLAQLSGIESSVSQVGLVMAEIAEATAEQSRGVELIDASLGAITSQTQAVAATAEQSNDAAAALTAQSDRLHELVGGFVLPPVARDAAPPRQPRGASRASIGRSPREVVPSDSRGARDDEAAIDLESLAAF